MELAGAAGAGDGSAGAAAVSQRAVVQACQGRMVRPLSLAAEQTGAEARRRRHALAAVETEYVAANIAVVASSRWVAVDAVSEGCTTVVRSAFVVGDVGGWAAAEPSKEVGSGAEAEVVQDT